MSGRPRSHPERSRWKERALPPAESIQTEPAPPPRAAGSPARRRPARWPRRENRLGRDPDRSHHGQKRKHRTPHGTPHRTSPPSHIATFEWRLSHDEPTSASKDCQRRNLGSPTKKATEIAPEIRTYWQRFCRLYQSSGKTVQNWTRPASILKDTRVELRHPADDRGLRSAVKVPASRSARILGRYSNGRG